MSYNITKSNAYFTVSQLSYLQYVSSDVNTVWTHYLFRIFQVNGTRKHPPLAPVQRTLLNSSVLDRPRGIALHPVKGSVLCYITINYRTVPNITINYRTVPNITINYRTVPSITINYRTIPNITINYRTIHM